MQIYQEISNTIRILSAEAVQKAKSGHPGLPLGCADIATVLWGEILKYDPSWPDWPGRDRFILSAGHGSSLLYSVLHLTGYDLPLEELKQFRQLGSRTPGHPEYGVTAGVETTTGPLGQGLANAVGMAIAERHLAAKFNTEDQQIINNYTYVLAGDGCMMEGITSEAASLAGHLGLDKLIVIYDRNMISIEGSTELAFGEDVAQRYLAYGWDVQEIDGHDFGAIRTAINQAKTSKGKPHLIIAKTVIGKHAPSKAGKAAAHGEPLGEEELQGLKLALGQPPEAAFVVPEAVQAYFAQRAQNLKQVSQSWRETFAAWRARNPELAAQWDAAMNLAVPRNLKLPEITEAMATRASSGKVLQAVAAALPYLVGGSADLAPSTKTWLEGSEAFGPNNPGGRNFHFGVREHAMGAIANGLSLYGGLRPFVSTFLVFADYMRPTLRLAALMKQPVIFIFTHDSFYVGEDGPTHQPVEHTESLRNIPGLYVFRPADAAEVAAVWREIVQIKDHPVALLLTRQNLPLVEKAEAINPAGYLVTNPAGPQVCLVATGSEVALAVDAAAILAKDGIQTRVVSIPCRELWEAQDRAFQNRLVPPEIPTVVLEAGRAGAWGTVLNRPILPITVETFGESGPAAAVAAHLGFTGPQVAAKVKQAL